MTTRGQVRHAFPAFKIYIFGIDVTEDVFDVSVNWNYGRAPNTCTFTLGNPDDKYILTTDNIRTLFKGNQKIIDAAAENNKLFRANIGQIDLGLYQYIDEQDIQDQLSQNAINNIQLLTPDVKRRVVEKKYTVKAKDENGEDIKAQDVDGEESVQSALSGKAYRYPFSAEDPIFHPNDPIRIFYRDPNSPYRWYHMFSGFASDYEDSVDENNQRLLTISGEGPTKLLRYARVTTNPGVIDIDAVAVSEEDIALRSAWLSGFRGLTLPELIFSMIFGNDPNNETKFSIRRDSVDTQAIAKTLFKGVGHFNYQRSAVLEYGPISSGGNEESLQSVNILSINDLKSWQSLIDHEVKIADIEEMSIPDFDWTTLMNNVVRFADGNTPDPTSIIKIIGENPQYFPVDGGRVLMLVPASFHPQVNREILLRDMVQNFRLQTEFSSRLGVIYDTIERIEFVFYESPKGDLICEFPFYDFDPDDFGLEETVKHVGIRNQNIFTSPWEIDERGPFGDRFIISKRDTYNFSRNYTDEKIRTQMIAYWLPIQNMEATGTSREFAKPTGITLKHLFPLYGARLEQMPPKAFIASKEAAKALSHVWLNRMNADAINLGINMVPNFGLWLNRPVQFLPRNSIGTISSLGHSIKWGMGGSADTRANLQYVRTWDGLYDSDGKPIYTPIGGIPSRPLNYKLLFKQINVESGNNPDTPSTSSGG